MDKVDETSQDLNNLYNFTTSLATSLSYHQLVLYIRSVLENLQDSLSYIKTVSTHTMDYIDAATTGTLSPHILPIMDLRRMLSHIEETLWYYNTSPCFIWGTPCISITIFVHMFWSPTSNSYSSLMYQFRTGHNNSPSTKYLLWIFYMVILQLAMISIFNTSKLHKMKPWQWKSQHDS